MIQFDTLTYAKKLRDAGFAEQQAEALKAVIDENLATKQDIALVQRDIESIRLEIEQSRHELRVEIEQLRRDLRAEIEQSRSESNSAIERLRGEVQRDLKSLELKLTVRMGVMAAAIIAILASLMRVL